MCPTRTWTASPWSISSRSFTCNCTNYTAYVVYKLLYGICRAKTMNQSELVAATAQFSFICMATMLKADQGTVMI